METERYLVVTTDDIHFCVTAALLHSFNYNTFVFCIPAATVIDEAKARELDAHICQLPYRPTTILFLGNFRDYISRRRIFRLHDGMSDTFEKHFGPTGVAMVMYCDSEECVESFSNVTAASDRKDMHSWRKKTARYRCGLEKQQKVFSKYLALRTKRIMKNPMSKKEASKWSCWRQPALNKLRNSRVFTKNATGGSLGAATSKDPFTYRKSFLDAMRDRITDIMHPKLDPEETAAAASLSPPPPHVIVDADNIPCEDGMECQSPILGNDQDDGERCLIVHKEQISLVRFVFETLPLEQRSNAAYKVFRSTHRNLLIDLNYWGFSCRQRDLSTEETSDARHISAVPRTVGSTHNLCPDFQKIDWAAEAVEKIHSWDNDADNNEEVQEAKRGVISILNKRELDHDNGVDKGEHRVNSKDKMYRIHAFVRIFMGSFSYENFAECAEQEFKERSRSPFQKKMNEYIKDLECLVTQFYNGQQIPRIHEVLLELQACRDAEPILQCEYKHYMETEPCAQSLHAMFPGWKLAQDVETRF